MKSRLNTQVLNIECSKRPRLTINLSVCSVYIKCSCYSIFTSNRLHCMHIYVFWCSFLLLFRCKHLFVLMTFSCCSNEKQ